MTEDLLYSFLKAHYRGKLFDPIFSCTFNSTLDDIRQGRERDGDVDSNWEGKGYCLCTEVTNIIDFKILISVVLTI